MEPNHCNSEREGMVRKIYNKIQQQKNLLEISLKDFNRSCLFFFLFSHKGEKYSFCAKMKLQLNSTIKLSILKK